LGDEGAIAVTLLPGAVPSTPRGHPRHPPNGQALRPEPVRKAGGSALSDGHASAASGRTPREGAVADS